MEGTPRDSREVIVRAAVTRVFAMGIEVEIRVTSNSVETQDNPIEAIRKHGPFLVDGST